MREIKFKAWDGRMMRYSWDGWSEMTDILDEVWKIAQEDYKYKIMQYTGLKDMNSLEIYEGDLLTSYGKTYEVVFDNGCFCYSSNEIGANNKLPYKRVEPFKQYIGPWKVIGNIYENPELIHP